MNTISFGMALLIAVPAAYMIGSIPFAVIAGYLLRGDDIRNGGSGNAGATNTFRVLGWKAALPVLAADMLKGFLPVLFIPNLFPALTDDYVTILQIAVLTAVVTGHAFPLWAGFRGGKGVASSAGGILAMFPLVAPFCLTGFLIVLITTRYVSLSSLTAAWILPPAYGIAVRFSIHPFSPWLMGFFLTAAIGVTILHRKNIGRLIHGVEKRLGNQGH